MTRQKEGGSRMGKMEWDIERVGKGDGLNESVRKMPGGRNAADNGMGGMAAAGKSTAAPAVGRKAAEDSAQDRHRYDDIINLPRHISKLHSPMPVEDRAAQFMPFAALTGFEGAIRETGRLTDAEPKLAEDATEGLDGKLQYLRERIGEHPEISVTYFQPDARKAGGAFVTAAGQIKKIDFYERVLVMEDGMAVPMKAVMGLEGEIFSDLDG